MPSTYTLISSNVLSSSAASVSFTSIPATYTDLALRISTRISQSAYVESFTMRFNSDSATNYSYTSISAFYAGANTVLTERLANRSQIDDNISDANTNTSNTFTSREFYIPSYTVSQNKPIINFGVTEGNFSTTDYTWWIDSKAHLWRNTAAISSISLTTSAGSFVSSSSFYLYGISKS